MPHEMIPSAENYVKTLVAGPEQVFGTTDTLPRRPTQTSPPHACDCAPLVSNVLRGLELRRPSPVPNPRRSVLAWASPHPHCRLENHPASPRVAGQRVLISDLRRAGEAALPPVLQQHEPHGTRPAPPQNGLAVPASSAPAPPLLPPPPPPLLSSLPPRPASFPPSRPVARLRRHLGPRLPDRALSQRREPVRPRFFRRLQQPPAPVASNRLWLPPPTREREGWAAGFSPFQRPARARFPPAGAGPLLREVVAVRPDGGLDWTRRRPGWSHPGRKSSN
uniref:uncharacterized protein LOC103791486 isoform X2 n=1 Tax=Callithrix jacchus TaxID=9483 RepID=UPI0023DD566F|nr:uncharacterized protein LOC103791486 isoform X2 [Callithrix jacchus]